MSGQGVKLKAIADSIRAQEGTAAPIPAKDFAGRILTLPVGVDSPGVVLPAASTQEGHFARIAAAIRAKEGSAAPIPAVAFADRILALEPLGAGLEWVQGTLPASRYYRDAAFGNGNFVVVGGQPVSGGEKSMLYSSDGTSWTVSTNGSSTRILTSVVYGEGKRFAAVGYSNSNPIKPLIMTNGTGAQSWILRNNPSGTASGKQWTRIAYGNDRFVIISNGTDAAYSADAASWTLTSMPFSANWQGLAFGNGRFAAAVYGGNQAAVSPDGESWTVSTLPFTANWLRIAFGAGKYVAIPYGSGQGAYSEDAVTWKAMNLPSSADWQALTYGAGKFVALAYRSSQSIYSYDGVNWKEAELPASRSWRGVACGADKLVACAYNSSYFAYAAA